MATSKSNSNFEVRPAKADDCDEIANLIKQLAVYQRCPDEPKLSGIDLRRDGFEIESPLFNCQVAEVQHDGLKKIVGFVTYFNYYSTWKGHGLYLQDFYVDQPYRNNGIGSQLFKRLAQEVAKTKSKRLLFNVLDWNTSSIEFYKKRGAINLCESEGWLAFQLEGENLTKLADQ